MVAAYKGGSPDIDSSWSRVDKYAEELRTKWKLTLEPDIPTLCAKVDAILLESNDGRKHLPQAKQVIAAHKPMFIDKPLASTLEDAREIAQLAREAGVPFFSSSSARFAGIATAMKFPDSQGAIVWGPGPLEPHHYLDLSWYAIHPIELLYTLMGTGCEEVTRMAPRIPTKWWAAGRAAGSVASAPTVRTASKGRWSSARTIGSVQSDKTMMEGYGPLLHEIVKFFQTAGRRSPPKRRWRSWHSWTPPNGARKPAESRCACADHRYE